MQLDGYLVTKQPKLRHALCWPGAARLFVESRTEFLREDAVKQAIVGQWSVVCFPFKGLTNKRLDELTSADFKRIRGVLTLLKITTRPSNYSLIAEVERLFKAELEYPPYSLKDDWDGNAMRRRFWAEHVYRLRLV